MCHVLYVYGVSDSMDVGGELGCSGELERLVAKKYINLYTKLADTARLQVRAYTCTCMINLCNIERCYWRVLA